MTSHLRHPEEVDAAFALRLKLHLPADISWGDVKVLPNGLAVAVKESGMRPLGCPTCFHSARGQTTLGEPTAGGKPLLRGEDQPEVPKNLPQEVLSNIWLCPDCRTPVTQLLPNFEQRIPK